MRKRQKEFPHATPYTDRHGTRRWRYRQHGRSFELGTDYGSPEFIRRYTHKLPEDRLERLREVLSQHPGEFGPLKLEADEAPAKDDDPSMDM